MTGSSSAAKWPPRSTSIHRVMVFSSSALQTPGDWTGSDLAERLGVDVRTIRRDIDKLRALGHRDGPPTPAPP